MGSVQMHVVGIWVPLVNVLVLALTLVFSAQPAQADEALTERNKALVRDAVLEIHPAMKLTVNDCGRGLFALVFFYRRQDRELPDAISRGLMDYPCRV